LIPVIDADADGVISEAEQRLYAERILRDLSLVIDGHRLAPRLTTVEFPANGEMKEGRGEIRIGFDAVLPRGGADRKLTFENRHQSAISVYQVNVLVPRDPDIRIVSQNRNYSQSLYQLDFDQAVVSAAAGPVAASLPVQFAILVVAAFSAMVLIRTLRNRKADAREERSGTARPIVDVGAHRMKEVNR